MNPTDLFARPQPDGSLVFGHALPCHHCGDVAPARESHTTKGTLVRSFYPSDTCCPARAREVFENNRLWIHRYRNLAHQAGGFSREEYLREMRELEASNAEIKRVMTARQGAA